MKIFKEGKIDDLEYKVRCWSCNTLFSFYRSETHPSYHLNELYRSINCPICGKVIYV